MPIRSRSHNTETIIPVMPSLVLHEQVGGKGRGVFTSHGFVKGEEVIEFLGSIQDVEEFSDLTYALQIGPTSFIGPSGGIDDFVNHSCEPNTGIRDAAGRIVLFALRDIDKDEEITFDYSTTQSGGFFSFKCQCGTDNCRGTIGDFAALDPQIQSYYTKRKAVLPFLLTFSK